MDEFERDAFRKNLKHHQDNAPELAALAAKLVIEIGERFPDEARCAEQAGDLPHYRKFIELLAAGIVLGNATAAAHDIGSHQVYEGRGVVRMVVDDDSPPCDVAGWANYLGSDSTYTVARLTAEQLACYCPAARFWRQHGVLDPGRLPALHPSGRTGPYADGADPRDD